MVANLQYTSPMQFKISQTAPPISSILDTQKAVNDLFLVVQQLIQTLQPSGQAGNVISFRASEAIILGAAVNVYNNAGIIGIRNANSNSTIKMCHGFALTPITSGTYGAISFGNQLLLGLSGLTLGSNYWLSSVGGTIQATPDTAAGHIEQYVGIALDATSLYIKPGNWIQH